MIAWNDKNPDVVKNINTKGSFFVKDKKVFIVKSLDLVKLGITLEQLSRVTLGNIYRLHHLNLHKIVWRLTEFCAAMYQVVSTL